MHSAKIHYRRELVVLREGGWLASGRQLVAAQTWTEPALGRRGHEDRYASGCTSLGTFFPSDVGAVAPFSSKPVPQRTVNWHAVIPNSRGLAHKTLASYVLQTVKVAPA